MTPSAHSHTNLRGARITGSALATGTGSNVTVSRGGDPRLDEVLALIAQLQSDLAAIRDTESEASVAGMSEDATRLQQEVTGPSPDRGKVKALLGSLLATSADVVTVAPAVGSLAAVAGAYMGVT